MMEQVTFNDIVISDFFQVAGVRRPLAGRVNSTLEISGMDGTRVTGSVMMPSTLSVLLVVSDMNDTQRRDAVRNLSSMIHTDEPKVLSFSSDNGLYYKAILDGEVPFQEHVRSGIVELNFITESPVLYGAVRSVTVPSQGEVTVYVDGTYPALPKITGNVQGTASNGLWGLRLDDGDYMRIVTGSNSTRAIVMDSESRTASVAGAAKLPTLDSDWFELGAGMHKIKNDVGSGSSTVTWQERWL